MHTNWSDLLTWLREQIDEDERVVKCADPSAADIADGWFTGEDDVKFIRHYTSRRTLADVEAKREILGACARDVEYGSTSGAELAAIAIRAMTIPYVDRPGYRSHWGAGLGSA